MSAGPDQKTAELMTRFLLGELSEEERPAMEERFLSDNQFFDHLLVMEDSLIDAYLLGRLSDDRRQRAELLLQSSSAQRREVEFTRELISFLSEARSETTAADANAGHALPDNDLSVRARTVELVNPSDKEPASRAPLALIVAGLKGLSPLY